MAGSVNKVFLVGRLGKNPELRMTKNGTAVANFSLATSESYKTAEGRWEERTEWHTIVVWGNQAKNCEKFLSKGRQVCIEGRIQTREWNDSQGQKRRTTEIIANQVIFLGTGGGSESPPPYEPPQGASSGGGGYEAESPMDEEPPPPDDDIPF